MSQDSQTNVTEPADDLSLVQAKETSVHGRNEKSYRASLLDGMESEYARTEELYQSLDLEETKTRTDSLQTCRTNAWFAIHLQSGTVRVLSDSCRLRWCPICSKSRSRVIVSNLEPWIQKCRAPKFLTLTLKHSNDSLDLQISRLYACFREFRRRKYIKDSIRGGVWFFQIKRSEKSGEWHPHLHCAMDAEYMPHRVISKIWHEVTGDSTVVDIRAIHNPKKAAEYIARYAARPAKLAEYDWPDVREIYFALHKRIICRTWGDVGDAKLSKPPGIVQGEYIPICPFSDLQRLAKNSFFAETCRQVFYTKARFPLCWSRTYMQSMVDGMYSDGIRDIRPPPKPDAPCFTDDDGAWLLQRYV